MPTERDASLRGVRVLLIEDNDDLREIFAFWLKRAGAEVASAGGGSEALDLLVRLVPDVVVCDLHMPHMDGCEFIERFRDLAGMGSIPVIAVTGSKSDAALVDIVDAGFAAHLLKPVTSEALIGQIERALGHGDESRPGGGA